MADIKVINEWLKKADEDYEFANSVIDDQSVILCGGDLRCSK